MKHSTSRDGVSMSSGDDDYGNPQREIEHQRVLLAMRDERITLLRTQLQAAQERAERWKAEAMALRAADDASDDAADTDPAEYQRLWNVARSARALNDTQEPTRPPESNP